MAGLVALALGLGGALVVGSAVWQSLRQRANEVSKLDRQCLISVEQLAGIVKVPGDRQLCEAWSKHEDSEGGVKLKYAYDARKDPASSGIFTLTCRVRFNSRPADAEEYFESELWLADMLAKLSDGTLMQRKDELLELGDDQFVALYRNELQKTGVAAAVRVENTVIGISMTGHCIDDEATLRRLFADSVAAVQENLRARRRTSNR